ncbi:hypothetical protein E2C01_092487 [Portunus trituberculatus]|uniref:Uncharacterized protein n=1 Tax=Portunus trituberculatus TaxID=210409 RepID=A0A5B7JS64_PORTR|nr:hypothetical protein [Portunus trituberculatus]
MANLRPTPPRPPPSRPIHFPADLRDAAAVFLRTGATTGPLQPLYVGPFRVLHRGPSVRRFVGLGEVDSPVSCSAHGAAPAPTAAPSSRGGTLAPSSPQGDGTVLPAAAGRHRGDPLLVGAGVLISPPGKPGAAGKPPSTTTHPTCLPAPISSSCQFSRRHHPLWQVKPTP